MHDLVIRNGLVVDGTGAPARVGDVAVHDGRIVAVGDGVGRSRRTIDADGLVVTPGWVDVHTHYDGQACWDPYLSPSSGHGVTTAVMGNCGVGFAPAAPERHAWLIELMEGVEDVPGTALSEGLSWEWESFPEYLDALEQRPFAVDVAALVAHGPVRAYVMGERGARNEPATPDDVAAMAAIVAEAVRAGALGFSTSRTMLHRALDGEPVPGTFAGADELLALGAAMAAAGGGVFEVASDLGLGGMGGRFGHDLDWMAELSTSTGSPVLYILQEADWAPEQWRDLIEMAAEHNRRGARLVAQVPGHPAGILLGLETTLHPFLRHPTYEAIAHLPLSERVAELSKPEVRARIRGERTTFTGRFNDRIAHGFDKMYPLGDPPDYEPPAARSVEALARAAGREPAELAYDLLLQDDGRSLLFFPLADYAYKTLDSLHERLERDDVVLSLSDGGAHCRLICDASTPTWMLTHWVRDRDGARLSLERAVQLQTSRTAGLFGLHDRGVVAPGYRADLNVIDLGRLRLHRPEMVDDLPGGANRFVQKADGYVATIVVGSVTLEQGTPTGALPGRLVRGQQAAPQ